MLRGLLIASLALTIVFAVILGGLRLQPRANPAEAVLVGCAMPCWKGIAPGNTSSQDALAVLNTAIGHQPYVDMCSFPLSEAACIQYVWTSPDGTTPYAEMAIERQEIHALIIYTPSFTLGDALLTLRGLHVEMDGVYPGFRTNQQFYLQFLFAHSDLILRASVPCPGSYLDLLQTPVRTIEVDAPRLDVPASTMKSFAAVRAAFAQVCS